MRKPVVLILIALLFACLCAAAGAAGSGWTKEGDHLCYYRNGESLRGTATIGGTVYEFTEEGWLKGDGSIRYISGSCYLIGRDNKIRTGWQKVGGKKYYFRPGDGRGCRNGTSRIGSAVYVFDHEGALLKNSWYGSIYGDRNGKILTGYQTVSGYRYLFGEDGRSQSGLHTIQGKLHYFTSQSGAAGYPERHGWIRIGTSLYYFDPATGAAPTSGRKIDGKTYQFSADGTLVIASPLVLKMGSLYYGFDTDASYLQGWQTIDGATYCFGGDSLPDDYAALTGEHALSRDGRDAYYYFDGQGRLQTCVWATVDGKKFYYGADGRRLTGLQTIDGATYYISSEYGMLTGVRKIYVYIDNDHYGYCEYCFAADGKMRTGWVTVDKTLRYYGSDGRRVYGFQKIDGSTYYLTENGLQIGYLSKSEYKDGVYLGKSWYYFDRDGKMVTGWAVIDGKTYYFDTDGKRLGGKQVIDGKTYYFDQDNGKQTGFVEIWDQEKEIYYYSYCNENGEIRTGWITVGEDTFYSDPDGRILLEWATIGGKTYYFRTYWAYSGNTAAFRIGMYRDTSVWLDRENVRREFCFDRDGVLQNDLIPLGATNRWVQKGGNWYYSDGDGYAVTGPKAINGTYYCFDHSGVMITGWAKVLGKWYFAKPDGELYRNCWKRSGGAWYYFTESGAMATGWMDIWDDQYGYGKYCFDQNGIMQTGWIRIGGSWYYLDSEGRRFIGWLRSGSAWYFLRYDNGTMATGWYNDGGTWYWFDSSGRMATGWKEISGTWEYFSDTGRWLYSWSGS